MHAGYDDGHDDDDDDDEDDDSEDDGECSPEFLNLCLGLKMSAILFGLGRQGSRLIIRKHLAAASFNPTILEGGGSGF